MLITANLDRRSNMGASQCQSSVRVHCLCSFVETYMPDAGTGVGVNVVIMHVLTTEHVQNVINILHRPNNQMHAQKF